MTRPSNGRRDGCSTYTFLELNCRRTLLGKIAELLVLTRSTTISPILPVGIASSFTLQLPGLSSAAVSKCGADHPSKVCPSLLTILTVSIQVIFNDLNGPQMENSRKWQPP
jgi:hypothetical protein